MGWGGQLDAAHQTLSTDTLVSTDPPYYDNIGYADLSDFFFLWLRSTVRLIYPDLFATLAVPKAQELVADPFRHGNRETAKAFFLAGMAEAMRSLAERAHRGFPVSIYYAFKQFETKDETDASSTGWESFLDALIRAGFSITGTWPMRTEGSGKDPSKRCQRPRLQHRPYLSPTTGRRAFSHPSRVCRRAQSRTAHRPRSTTSQQHRAGRPCPSGHRAGHGDLHPLRQGPGR